MLEHAKKKASRSNSSVVFRQQDMRTVDVPERPFDAVICLFDSLGYVATNNNILNVFRGVYDHLAADGVFLFEFWHAGAMLRSYDPLRIRRFKTPTSEIMRISETRVDYKEQICQVAYTIHEFKTDGTYQTIHETQVNRFFLVQEMNLFLHQTGFTPIHWFSGFQEDEPITADSWHIVALARKADKSI
jgi:SAM-dependent methyltransferase